MDVDQTNIPLILFAKTPLLGKVKTRLQPECSTEQALAVAKILLEESIRVATRFWKGKVILSVWPTLDDDYIQKMSQAYPIELSLQTNGDLGDKMNAAFTEFGYPMAIMGCDAPHITEAALTTCYSCLVETENCIGESIDGGYYLLGLSRSCPEIFKGIDWGNETVFKQTMETAAKQLLKFKQLPNLNDIDTWQDLIGASDHLPNVYNYLSEQELI